MKNVILVVAFFLSLSAAKAAEIKRLLVYEDAYHAGISAPGVKTSAKGAVSAGWTQGQLAGSYSGYYRAVGALSLVPLKWAGPGAYIYYKKLTTNGYGQLLAHPIEEWGIAFITAGTPAVFGKPQTGDFIVDFYPIEEVE